MRGAALAIAAAAALALLARARADVIFRVPEVLVRHAAASKSVGTGRASPNTTNSSAWSSDDGVLEVSYEEYFVEHEVSTADARKAAKELNLDKDHAALQAIQVGRSKEAGLFEERTLNVNVELPHRP